MASTGGFVRLLEDGVSERVLEDDGSTRFLEDLWAAAEAATGTGGAFDATVSSSASIAAGLAAATGAAFDATVATAGDRNATADVAAGTASAFDASVSSGVASDEVRRLFGQLR